MLVSTQRFFSLSKEPWGVKDLQGNYVYVNNAYFDFLEIPAVSRDSFYTDQNGLISPLIPICHKLVEHDKKVIESIKRSEGVGTIIVNGKYKSFIQEQYPQISEKEEIIGLVFHLRPFEQISTSYFFDKSLHGIVTYSPPTQLFTSREWDILFLLFQHIDRKQIATRLGISGITVRNLVSRLLLKTGTSTKNQLVAMGIREGWHLYIPQKFAEIGYEILLD
ncbi:helix-turn-helix transcriptional regulator [Salmonella enterica]|nr:helix-turn-helix transcriptional regulator [Salmonella enterica]